MKKRYLVLTVVILIDACILLTGFNNAGSDAEYLLEQRTNLFKLLQYGELTQNTAIKRLYEIETGQQLEADIGYVESFSNTEICRVEDMYIKKLERTVCKSGYEVYSAVIDWRFEKGLYESIGYTIVIKKTDEKCKIAGISVRQ